MHTSWHVQFMYIASISLQVCVCWEPSWTPRECLEACTKLSADTTTKVVSKTCLLPDNSNFSLNPHAVWVRNGARDDAPEAIVQHAWEGSGADFFPRSALRKRGRLRPKSGFINLKYMLYKTHLPTGLQLPQTGLVQSRRWGLFVSNV